MAEISRIGIIGIEDIGKELGYGEGAVVDIGFLFKTLWRENCPHPQTYEGGKMKCHGLIMKHFVWIMMCISIYLHMLTLMFVNLLLNICT